MHIFFLSLRAWINVAAELWLSGLKKWVPMVFEEGEELKIQYHTRCGTGPRFLWSHTKYHPIQSPFTTCNQGVTRGETVKYNILSGCTFSCLRKPSLLSSLPCSWSSSINADEIEKSYSPFLMKAFLLKRIFVCTKTLRYKKDDDIQARIHCRPFK